MLYLLLILCYIIVDKDEDEVDVAELKEEANMPLTELIAKYASGGGKNPALLRVSGDSSSQPASPYLKAKPGTALLLLIDVIMIG